MVLQVFTYTSPCHFLFISAQRTKIPILLGLQNVDISKKCLLVQIRDIKKKSFSVLFRFKVFELHIRPSG